MTRGRFLAILFAALTLLPLAAEAQSNDSSSSSYYNVTGIRCEQLSNAVRVTIMTDGVISYNFTDSDFVDWDLMSRQNWQMSPEVLKSSQKLRIRLYNARSQVGSFVQIGRYPVSHAEVSIPPSTEGRFDLDVNLVLFAPVKMRSEGAAEYQASNDEDQRDAPPDYKEYIGDTPWFEISRSPDRRSVIITVSSSRRPEIIERLTPDGIPASQRELSVNYEDGLVELHARNAELRDVVEAVSRVSGRKMIVDGSTSRLINAELPHVTPDEFAERIAECYSLVLNGSPECRVFSEIVAETISSYTSGKTVEIPVRYLTAARARDLLPNFLLPQIRVDAERNVLIVPGSYELADKVRADIAKIDKPGVRVKLRARLVEASSVEDVSKSLAARYSSDANSASFNSAVGDLIYSTLGTEDVELEAKLSAMAATGEVHIRDDASLTVQSGESGELFAGLNKFIQVETITWRGLEVAVKPVSAGTRLTVVPRTAGESILVYVTSDVKNVGEEDPKTRLPVINSRSASGTFRIKPGGTILIGGLSQTQVTNTRRRIPILGQLPIIGGLFRVKARQKVDSNLAVLLTASIAAGDEKLPASAGSVER